MVRARVIAGFLLTLAASSFAQEHPHGNGEKLGTVHFATSCNEVAQKESNRAVALLHSFQFSRAIDGFNAVLGEDATCGIAYWGMALSDWSNPFAPGIKDKSHLQAGRESGERGKTVGAKISRQLSTDMFSMGAAALFPDVDGSWRSLMICTDSYHPCGLDRLSASRKGPAGPLAG